jgi:vesicle coat complex subunit
MCRIKEFSEWAQCIVLELASKFLPSDNNEIFDIMNLLEDRLQHANGAVVLATIKVFLHLTMSMTDVHQQVHMLLSETWFGSCCTIYCFSEAFLSFLFWI